MVVGGMAHLFHGPVASMKRGPDLSVVMSVYNAANTLPVTMDSVLSQEGVDLEFIVIDDGSSDGSGAILENYAKRDDRVRVLRQQNTGLTPALIRGCAEARGRYIARQDAGGDLSLTGRLARQYAVLESNTDVVLTSCGTRFVGPEGESLYEVTQQAHELQSGLEQLVINRIRGPSHHGSTMFRQAAYQAVGGYCPVYRVAQDLDLWLRLVEFGSCIASPEILYQASLTHGAISHSLRHEQLKSAYTILNCAVIRRTGGDEKALLNKFIKYDCKIKRGWTPRSLQDARFYYFVGTLLHHKEPDRARMYYRRALQYWLFYPRALLRLGLLKEHP
jgi:glycosyltransferase involved in cell wall biosynthesis